MQTENEENPPAPANDDAARAAAPESPEGDPTEALKAEIADLKDRVLRALAEGENIRRRGEREREDTSKYAISNFARDIVAVADNLGRALAAIPAEARKTDPALETLAVGVEMTGRELLAALERHGIRRIDPLGEKFSHDHHQALFEVPGTGKPAGTIVQVVQFGYIIHDRLLRAAMVGIAKDETAPKPETPA